MSDEWLATEHLDLFMQEMGVFLDGDMKDEIHWYQVKKELEGIKAKARKVAALEEALEKAYWAIDPIWATTMQLYDHQPMTDIPVTSNVIKALHDAHAKLGDLRRAALTERG